MIYQFLEDNTGKVIAESIHGELTSVLNFRYPEFDIPAQARALYLKNLSRQIPDVFGKNIQLIGKKDGEINLSKSHIRAVSPIHLKYLENTGVTASASFSIIVNSKLWGLVCCQNKKQKHITVDQRNLCTFLINYTTNAYIIQEKNIVLAQNEFINKIELELKEELFYNQNIPSILNDFSERFIKILSADGLIIKSPNGLSKYGDTPSDKTFEAIVNEINSIAKDQFIYTTHSFSNDKINKTLNTKNCTGIARINFDKEAFYSIYLFRKEIIKEEIWAGIPEKIKNLSADKKNYTYSLEPRLMLGKNK